MFCAETLVSGVWKSSVQGLEFSADDLGMEFSADDLGFGVECW